METTGNDLNGHETEDGDIRDHSYRIFTEFCEKLETKSEKLPQPGEFCCRLKGTHAEQDKLREDLNFALFMHKLFKNSISESQSIQAQIENARGEIWQRLKPMIEQE